MGFNII